MYSYAVNHLGLLDTPPFEYIVMYASGVQRFTVQRGPDDWAALTDHCLGLATLIEANLPRWPTDFSNVLCSPVWCASWSTCRGQHLGADPWDQGIAA